MDRLDTKRLQIWEAVRDLRGPLGTLIVRDVMTVAPCSVAADACILDVVKLYHARGFRHLLVLDSRGRLVGVVSDRDVIRCFGPASPPEQDHLRELPVSSIMSRDLVTTTPDASMLRAIDEMLAHGINCLPVLSGDDVVGILTTTDAAVLLETLLQSSLAASPEEPDQPALCIPGN